MISPFICGALKFIYSAYFTFAGIAGCCAKSTVAPFDRVKILLQAHNKHYKHLGLSLLSTVIFYFLSKLSLFFFFLPELPPNHDSCTAFLHPTQEPT